MNIPDLQQQALDKIANLRPTGEALAIIPTYIGPWAVAAADAQRYLAENPNQQALFVYPHDRIRERFANYIAPIVGGSVTVASPETIRKGGHDRFAYVASGAESWPSVESFLDPRFVLRHSPTASGLRTAGAIILPRYAQVNTGRRQGFEWSRDDSIRYYSELYFAQGQPVSSQAIIRSAIAGNGPDKNRVVRGFTGIEGVRDEAGLRENIYHRGMTAEQRARTLRLIGEDLGHMPSTEEIKEYLRETGGPAYDTLIKDVGLAELRRLAGQNPNIQANARKETLGEWTASDSARLYLELCRQRGSDQLTRRDLEKILPAYPGPRRPTIDEMLAPFQTGAPGDLRTPYQRMKDAAAAPQDPTTDDQ